MSRGLEFAELQSWFAKQIKAQNIDWQSHPLQMDGQSPFDYQCQQLLLQAERHWRLKYGFAPSHGSLMKALFAAISDQDQQKKRPWWQAWFN